MDNSPPGETASAAWRGEAGTAADRLAELWSRGERPELERFLAPLGDLPPGELAAVLRLDQRQRWHSGERVPAESYLERYAQIRAEPDCAIDLIFSEYLLQEKEERPDSGAFLRRFPEYAGVLRAQIELHEALVTGPSEDTRRSGEELQHAPRSGAFRPSPFAPELPAAFGRYQVLRPLGKGGMGTVYVAKDVQLGRLVALKVPHLCGGQEAVLRERFFREARIAATFNHPHLCPVYDFGQQDGVYYLTMPLLEGESLAARLRRLGALPPRAAAQLVFLVARGLANAHAAGFIHRDLKPANVMLTPTGEPVVMDFGLARPATPAGDEEQLTATGVVLGTPAYLAPEQIGADSEAQTPLCDIYSLGVMLYEMLTGRLPFQGRIQNILREVLIHDPPPPSRFCAGLDSRLEAICLKAMARDAQARFASMEQFAQALEECLRDGAGRSLFPLRRRAALRRRTLTLVLAALLAVAAGATWIGFSWLTQPSAPAASLDAGDRWQGTFEFLPPFGGTGDVTVDIHERSGPEFRGTYATEGGAHQWHIQGSVKGEEIHWGFTKLIRGGRDNLALVGKGRVDGRIRNTEMDVKFHDPNDGSVAAMKLRPRK
jgi:hypothetical protein